MYDQDLIDKLLSMLNRENELKFQEDDIRETLKKRVAALAGASGAGDVIEAILMKLFEQAASERAYVRAYVPENFSELPDGDLEYLTQDFMDRVLRLSRIWKLLSPSEEPRMIAASRYLAENIDEDIHIEQLARLLFMNKKYLGTFIKKHIGMSFTEYVRKMKIERARKLLSDTNMCVYEIADMLHFKDTEYFSRIFKKETGCSPSLYTWDPNDDLAVGMREMLHDKEEVRVGVIGSLSGEYGYLDGGKKLLYELAVEEMNANGGIGGKPVRLFYRDYASDLTLVEKQVQELLDAKVDVVIGGFLSSAREIIRKIMDKHKKLYLYDSLYEGGVADHYTFVLASMPEQNLLPAVEYLLQKHKKKFYILSTDYNYGILSCEYAKYYVDKLGGEVLAAEYVPCQKTNFAITIENILERKPDVLITFLVGEKQGEFFKQWRKTGDKDISIITTSAISQGYMHLTTEAGTMENVYFSAAYTEELATDHSQNWRRKIRQRFSYDQIPYLGSDQEIAYMALYLYKMAVESCHSVETEAVIRALENGHFVLDAPGGLLSINPRDHHLIRDIGVYRVNAKNQVEQLQTIQGVQSEFVESILKERYHVRDGLKEMGRKSPNVQYNMMIYKI